MDAWDYSPASTARRFEAGTPPVPSIYAGIAGMELMKEIGIEETASHVRELTTLLIDGVEEELGGRVVTPHDPARRGPLVAVASKDERALVAALERERIVTSCRDGNLRISPHCYNNREDIEAVLAALGRHQDLLVSAV
jgi:selenocysteine lyase/cysteine desulfurase